MDLFPGRVTGNAEVQTETVRVGSRILICFVFGSPGKDLTLSLRLPSSLNSPRV